MIFDKGLIYLAWTASTTHFLVKKDMN